MSIPRPPRPGRAAASAVLASLALLAGCGEGGSPSDPDAPMVVTPQAPVFVSPSDSAVVTATVNGKRLSGIRLQFAGESRDVPELPVLSSEALDRGVLRPAGPGTATVTVLADSRTATLAVRVAPTGPAVFSLSVEPAGADPHVVVLAGSGLAQLPADVAVRIDGRPAAVLARGPATLRVRAPEVEPAGCAGGTSFGAVQVDGADVGSHLRAPLARRGEVRLAVGESHLLSAAESACIRLPDAGEYVLAYADLREVDAHRTAWDNPLSQGYRVTVADRSSAAAAAAPAARAAHARPAGLRASPLHAPHGATTSPVFGPCSDHDFTAVNFWCRSRPWQVGDTMRIRRPGNQADTVTARVYRVEQGYLVFAAIDGDNSAALRSFKGALDRAIPLTVQHGLPVLRAGVGGRDPVTSVGSGQLLTIIGDFPGGSVAGGCCFGETGVFSVVLLGSGLNSVYGEGSRATYLLTHELAHAWHYRWFYDTRPEGGDSGPHGGTWALEGGADLLAYEAIRRYAGVPWAANRRLDSFVEGAVDLPLRDEMAATGDLFAGYVESSSFLRDVVARLIRAGAEPDAAFRAVSHGALEGWYGHGPSAVPRAGFGARVSALLGAEWEPGAAILRYTLAQGADDLTSSPDLQNPFYQRVGTEPYREGFGAHRLRAGSGGTFTTQRSPLSSGLLRLEGRQGGSSVTAAADRPGIAWAIARIR